MMNPGLRIFLAISVLVYFFVIISMIKNKKLAVRYALLWMVIGLGMIVFIIFPKLEIWISNLVGIANPVNLVFFMYAVLSMCILMSLTSIITTSQDKNLKLTQAVTLLEKRVRELEEEKKD